MTDTAPAIDDTFATEAGNDQIDRAAAALRDAGHTVHVVDTVEEARALVNELLPTDQPVFSSQSETLRLSGLTDDIDVSGKFQSVRKKAAELGQDFAAYLKLTAAPEVVVGSVHAVTEQGHLVVASASGSQLAPYAYGAMTAIWVVGAQKVVPDLDTAIRRVRTYSLPREYERMQENYSQPSYVGKILIVERESMPNRTVVLVRQAIGY